MYGIVRKLLKTESSGPETVLIESPFGETTRVGDYCDTVLLAITTNKFVIAARKNELQKRERRRTDDDSNIQNFALSSVYPLNSVKIAIFKRTRRQSLKVVFSGVITRYFELGRMEGRKIFWQLWCRHVKEIRRGQLRWPYVTAKPSLTRLQNTQRWTDKHLYLGSKRETEDQNRPIPIPGIGRTEDKLYYLNPQPFESCDAYDRNETWIQCSEEVQATTPDRELTYTDDPNSNITYTSLMTTVGIIGQF